MKLTRFWKNSRASVVPMLAIMLVPLMGAVGGAIDFTRAYAARTDLQTALDSTALMLAKTAQMDTAAQLEAAATQDVNAMFSRSDTHNVVVNVLYTTTNGSKLTINGSGTVTTSFLRVVGFDTLNISATSAAAWGDTRLRVALVLDNTGSMANDNKMTALKTASHNLLTELENASQSPDDVYVSIIPFSKDVNVGSSNYQEAWLNWSLWDAKNGSCSGGSSWGWGWGGGNTQSSCTANGGTWTPANHSTWNGCVTDRDQNFDTTNDPPVSGSTLYPTEQYAFCPAQLVGLINDWTALSNKVDDMQPKGNTNQAIGLQMGWQSLTAAPFTIPPMDPNYKYQQAIILLSDGLNTQDRWYSSASLIDARQETTCDNIKAAGITIYTVQVNTDGEPTSTLLQNCASDAGKFFLLTSADQLITTFNQIGTALTNLRLTQ